MLICPVHKGIRGDGKGLGRGVSRAPFHVSVFLQIVDHREGRHPIIPLFHYSIIPVVSAANLRSMNSRTAS
jgi:hypothetical protein